MTKELKLEPNYKGVMFWSSEKSSNKCSCDGKGTLARGRVNKLTVTKISKVPKCSKAF